MPLSFLYLSFNYPSLGTSVNSLTSIPRFTDLGALEISMFLNKIFRVSEQWRFLALCTSSKFEIVKNK